jgi:hypothetical protein
MIKYLFMSKGGKRTNAKGISKEELEVLSSLSVPVVKRNDSSSPLFSCGERSRKGEMPILWLPHPRDLGLTFLVVLIHNLP